MTTTRRIPSLGQPSRLVETQPSREPRLPVGLAPIPARGPELQARIGPSRNR
jgi:hypothetical protein